jgi:lipoprotein-anchoring transpeptidase ErfK/SrfK
MRKLAVIALALVLTASCSKQETQQTGAEAQSQAANAAEKAKDKVSEAMDRIAIPIGGKDDPAAREKERFDEQWRQLQSFREQQAAKARQAQQDAAQQAPQITFAPNAKETLKGATPQTILAAPVAVPIKGDVSGPSVVKAQVYLDRLNFSVGALDGRWGRNSAIATFWFQRSRGIEGTGLLDEPTYRALAQQAGGAPALVQYTITADDAKGPFVKIPEDVYEKEKLDCLCYENMKEKLAEQFHTTTDFLDLLNPNVDLANAQAGASVWVPNVRPAQQAPQRDITRIQVSIAGNTFNAFDAAGNLVFHAPTTLGSKYDPSPSETLKVVKAVKDPHFHYQPKLFHEVDDSEPEANLNPGPNSPVGVVWIALSKPHFGIHGTSDPDSIGYASSHGCVRLTNWDARELADRINEGVQVEFIDTRAKKS